MRHIDIVLVSVNSPILCGLYENNILFESLQSDEPLLIGLPRLFESLLPTAEQNPAYKDTKIESIYYANGPGSFSALKLIHIFLHTLQSIYKIGLFATSSFYFTQSAYIKAFGTSYFYINPQGEIALKQNLESQPQEIEFALPQILDTSAFTAFTQPLYILPPV
ncbi:MULTISPECIES: hypothetical protein [Helicobacter]|uniref:TsaB protein, required for threonylcarbamoyladenosine (T(6)A) formation in tRNA n=1 Tax=Helicobacter mastomyrinus TaxID=287948 RepID=A0ABZ3F201_9HELI|nr:hypothetical protein [Helicobacter rodentium]